MNETFKTELAAFARDLREMCKSHTCANCPIGDKNGVCVRRITSDSFNLNEAIAAVEAYRKRKKPCAEVIDRALDVYTIEVEVVRGAVGATMPAEYFAEGAVSELRDYYESVGRPYAVRVLSAKRFVLESHRESDKEDAE